MKAGIRKLTATEVATLSIGYMPFTAATSVGAAKTG